MESVAPPNMADPRISLAEDAALDGEHHESAMIWRALRTDNPQTGQHYIKEIEAFRRCQDWASVDEAATAFYTARPDDPEAWLQWWKSPKEAADFGVALERARFLKKRHPQPLSAIMFEMSALLGMCEFGAVRELLETHFDQLLAEDPYRALHLAYISEEAGDFEHEAKAATAADRLAKEDDHRMTFRRARSKAAAANREWLTRNAPVMRLLSIGQNCLPWQVPNRWGFRPDAGEPHWEMAFNLAGFPEDHAASSIANRFEAFHHKPDFQRAVGPGALPMFLNSKAHLSFFHERGNYWLENDGENFHRLWAARIDNFLNALDRDGCVLFFALVGAGNLDILQETLLPYLDREHTRLAIVNLQQQDVPVPPLHPHADFAHIPYPRDYIWSNQDYYDSDTGMAFEHAISTFLMKVMKAAA